ncbi:MAG: phosphate acetyltransferase [Pseudoruegeria sp.]
MKPLQSLLRNAATSNKKICLSEGSDPRAIEAALLARQNNVAQIVLVGSAAEIRSGFEALHQPVPYGVEILDPSTSDLRDSFVDVLCEKRKHKGMTPEQAQKEVLNPHVFAALLVKTGYADGTVGGAVATTAEIVRTAIQVIGPKPGSKLISSFFLMLFCADHHPRKGAHVFSDAGLVVDPNAEEMAQIALDSAVSFATLTDDTPRVAMLSFSTSGSAAHEKVSKVQEATDLAKLRNPDLLLDGELQFDAAFVPSVAAKKASDSPLKGDANIFIFPNLDAGNIAYKIAQRIGGAEAIGPIMQGLDKPANDLSRGCSAEDILHMIAVTSAQAS